MHSNKLITYQKGERGGGHTDARLEHNPEVVQGMVVGASEEKGATGKQQTSDGVRDRSAKGPYNC